MTNKLSQKERLLTQNITPLMWRLAGPAIIAMVLFGLNAFMDTVYVGQLLDEKALAGVALAYPLTGIMLGLGSWIGTGAGNYVSILLGENDDVTIRKIIPNTNALSLLGSLLIAFPAYIFAEELMQIMGATGKILEYGTTYLRVSLIGAPFWIFGLKLNFIVRSEGKMKAAAIMMSYGLIVNIILTPLLMGYFGMHVEGAAWATNVGMGIYCIVGIIYFLSKRPTFESSILSIRLDKDIISKVLSLGFPGFIMTIMGLIQAIVVFNAIANVGGDEDLAFFAAANRIMMFLMTPLFGLMRALQPIAGVNYGAQQFGRIRESFNRFSQTGLLIILPFWIILMIFPEISIRLVLPDSIITSEDIFNFRIYMSILPFLPYVFMALTCLPAIDRPKPASLIGVARQLVFYVPVMLILPRFLGISGIYWGATIIDIIITIWVLVIVYKTFNQFQSKPILL